MILNSPNVKPHQNAASDTENTENSESLRKAGKSMDGFSVISVFSVLSVSEEQACQIDASLRKTANADPWERGLFEFARTIRTVRPDMEVGHLRQVVDMWHKAANLAHPIEDTRAAFAKAMEKVLMPEGGFERACQVVKRTPPHFEGYDAYETRLIIALCIALSNESCDGVFWLGGRDAAKLCGLDHKTAARRLSVLVSDKVLKIITPGTQSKATRYKLISVPPIKQPYEQGEV